MSRRRNPPVIIAQDPIFTIQHPTTRTPLPKRQVFPETTVNVTLTFSFNGRFLVSPQYKLALETVIVSGLTPQVREILQSYELLQ